jgi:hypothetical protein
MLPDDASSWFDYEYTSMLQTINSWILHHLYSKLHLRCKLDAALQMNQQGHEQSVRVAWPLAAYTRR